MKNRSHTGSHLVEFPVALLILIAFVFFVLVDVSTILLGVNNVNNAARVAAVDAAKASSYSAAVGRAQTAVNATLGGIEIVDLQVAVLQVPITTPVDNPDAEAAKNTPKLDLVSSQILPGPTPSIDKDFYQYQLQVKLIGSVKPLVTVEGLKPLVGNVPGLTAPLVVTATYLSHFENPQSLEE